jgi:hypothetical protein
MLLSLARAGPASPAQVEDSELQQLRVELDDLSIATLVNILEQQGTHVGDDYYSKEELVDMILQLVSSYESSHKESKASPQPGAAANDQPQQDDQETSTELSSLKTSTWDLVKQQVRNDLAPFILLIPQPVKTYLLHEVPKLLSTLQLSLRGALAPMLSVAVKAVRQVGLLLLQAAEKLEVLQRMSVVQQGSGDLGVRTSSSSASTGKGGQRSGRKPLARERQDEREVEL